MATKYDIEKAVDEGLKGMNGGMEEGWGEMEGEGKGERDGEGEGLFVVDVVVNGDEIMVTIDGDDRVSVDDCVALSRALREILKKDLGEAAVDEMSLTVSSAGIGQPLKVPRQYRKLKGKKAESVLEDGRKIVGIVKEIGEENITLELPGQESETFGLAEIKTIREHLEFK